MAYEKKKVGPYMADKARTMHGIGEQIKTANIVDMKTMGSCCSDEDYSMNYNQAKVAQRDKDVARLKKHMTPDYRQP